MELFSDTHFEYSVCRCLNFLILRYHHQIAVARDKEFAKTAIKESWKSFEEEYDECSHLIAKNFDRQYKLGNSMTDIIRMTWSIIDQFDYNQKENRSKSMRWRIFCIKKIGNYYFTIRIPTFRYFDWPQIPVAESFRHKKSLELGERTIFMALVKYRSACLFKDFLLSEKTNPATDMVQQPLAPVLQIQSGFLDEESVLKWTKPKSEFYKLVYALHSSGFIKGEITKIMQRIALAFEIPLAKSWQSSVSKNMDYSNGSFDSAEIFDELKTAFIKHVEERESKKR
mgnify:FL=1